MAKGPAAGYSAMWVYSVYTYMRKCIEYRVARVKKPAAALENYGELYRIIVLYRVISKCKKVWFTDRCVGVIMHSGPAVWGWVFDIVQ
jgi:hypothetical protein